MTKDKPIEGDIVTITRLEEFDYTDMITKFVNTFGKFEMEGKCN